MRNPPLSFGMTMRDYVALLVFQELLRKEIPPTRAEVQKLAQRAAIAADLLLAELEKGGAP